MTGSHPDGLPEVSGPHPDTSPKASCSHPDASRSTLLSSHSAPATGDPHRAMAVARYTAGVLRARDAYRQHLAELAEVKDDQ